MIYTQSGTRYFVERDGWLYRWRYFDQFAIECWVPERAPRHGALTVEQSGAYVHDRLAEAGLLAPRVP